jgi:hypothetical protein
MNPLVGIGLIVSNHTLKSLTAAIYGEDLVMFPTIGSALILAISALLILP